MERRAFLTVLISTLILLFYPYLIGRFFPQFKRARAPVAVSQKGPAASSVRVEPGAPSAETTSPPGEKEFVFESENYKAALSNIGGVIKSITLKKHLDSDTKTPIELVKVAHPNEAIFFTSGLDEEIERGLPFSLEQKAAGVKFTVKTRSGLKIEKEVTFNSDAYFLELEQRITNLSSDARTIKYRIVGGSCITALSKQDEPYLETVRSIDGKVTHTNVRGIKNSAALNGGQVDWVSLKNRYFSLILKPFVSSTAVYSKRLYNNKLQTEIETADIVLQPNSSVTHKFILYAGLNDSEQIRSLKLGLEDSLHLGFTGGIGRILLTTLKFFHRIVKNWGSAIIFLTLLINLVLYPFTFKSLKSMRQMQALQPKIEALRRDHKDNPQKVHKEIMEIYKKYKINPLGGCLPIILQMPIFLALYQVLMRSVELRGAPFLWIQDLSRPDRLFAFNFYIPWFGKELNILPILMGVSMFIQQKSSTPKKTAPSGTEDQYLQQQKLMAVMMPLMFGILFYHLPSGLVLYWLTNTLLTTFEQKMFLKQHLFHVEQIES